MLGEAVIAASWRYPGVLAMYVGLPEVLAFGRRRFSPPGFRTAIASLNRRSIVLYRSCPRECLTGQWNGSEWS